MLCTIFLKRNGAELWPTVCEIKLPWRTASEHQHHHLIQSNECKMEMALGGMLIFKLKGRCREGWVVAGMHKLSAFSHRNIDVGSPVTCFSHDYVQMEKEEASFVRAEVSPCSAPSRHDWRASLLQEPTKGLVHDQRLQAMLGEVARSVETLAVHVQSPLEPPSNFQNQTIPRVSPNRREDEEKNRKNCPIQFQPWFWIHV